MLMPEAYAHDGDASSVTQWDFQIRNRDGGSTLLSCRVRVANFAAKSRLLTGENSVRIRGTSPFLPMWLSSDSNSFLNFRALPHKNEGLSIGPISASLMKL